MTEAKCPVHTVYVCIYAGRVGIEECERSVERKWKIKGERERERERGRERERELQESRVDVAECISLKRLVVVSRC